MVVTVSKERQVSLPLEICEQLDIQPGARLDVRVGQGKLEIVKLSPRDPGAPVGSLKASYTPERNAEELIIQQGCSCQVPDEFPP